MGRIGWKAFVVYALHASGEKRSTSAARANEESSTRKRTMFGGKTRELWRDSAARHFLFMHCMHECKGGAPVPGGPTRRAQRESIQCSSANLENHGENWVVRLRCSHTECMSGQECFFFSRAG